MVIFHSYVSLPEGSRAWQWQWMADSADLPLQDSLSRPLPAMIDE